MDVVVRKPHLRNCVSQENELLLRKYRNLLIEKALQDPSRTLDESYNLVVQQMAINDPNYVATFPRRDRFATRYNKTIRRINPAIPEDLAVLEIPAPFNTFQGQPFVLHQETFAHNGRNETILVFGTERFMEALLTRSPVVGMDGTFKVVPAPFYQLFTIHFIWLRRALPGIYCLLTSKTEAIYNRLFEWLREYCAGMNWNLVWNTIKIDFESGLIPSLEFNFPEIMPFHGCYYHFCSCVYRYAVDHLGLGTAYRNPETHVKRYVKLLMALGFLPVHQVIEEFENLRDNEFPFQENDAETVAKLHELNDYFRYYWLGVGQGQGPHQSPETCNVYQEDNRTNNDLEGWHNKLNKQVGLNCILWKFIKSLKVMQGFAEADFARILRGEAITKQKKKYRDINERLRDLAVLLEAGNIDVQHYLLSVSNELGFAE